MNNTRELVDCFKETLEVYNIDIKSCHTHELLAAFFGYGSKAALDADNENFLKALNKEIWFFIPDLPLFTKRFNRLNLQDPNGDLPYICSSYADNISDYLEFYSWALECEINEQESGIEDFLRDNSFELSNQLSGVMSETNAYFDEEYFYNYCFSRTKNELIVTVDACIIGTNHPDRTFCGNEIDAEITLTCNLLAGSGLYEKPTICASGSVNYDWAEPVLKYGFVS